MTEEKLFPSKRTLEKIIKNSEVEFTTEEGIIDGSYDLMKVNYLIGKSVTTLLNGKQFCKIENNELYNWRVKEMVLRNLRELGYYVQEDWLGNVDVSLNRIEIPPRGMFTNH